MSHESELAYQQAFAGVDIFQQPDRAERCSRCSDWKGELEPGALSKGGQVINAKAYRV
jgi:hypothetical protein